MFSNNTMTPADIAAVTGGDGFSGSNSWVWLLIILLAFGWGGNGFGNNSTSGAAENYVLASDFATLQRQIDTTTSDIKQQGVAIGNGISSLGYDQLSRMNGIDSNIASSTNTLLMNANSGQNAIVAGITNLGSQMQSCCCENRYQSATQAADLNYRLAEQSCQTRQTVADSAATIVANQDANTRSILDALQAQAIAAKDDKIADLTAQVNALTLAASQQAQNNYIVSQLKPSPVPSYPASSLYGYYGSCSCGS